VVACLPDTDRPPVVGLPRARLRVGETFEQAMVRAAEIDGYANAVTLYLGLTASGWGLQLSNRTSELGDRGKVARLFPDLGLRRGGSCSALRG